MKIRKLTVFVLSLLFLACIGLTACGDSWHTVTFTDNGVTISEQKVMNGEKAVRPYLEPREGYLFDGWFLDQELYTFDQGVTKDLALVAQWSEAQFGAGTESDPLRISDESGLEKLAALAQNGGAVYAVLENDVVVSSGFAGIGTAEAPFCGSFDGKGFHLYGLNGAPLFGAVEDATVTNFSVSGSVSVSGGAAGVVAVAAGNSQITRVNAEVDVAGAAAGGIVGSLQGNSSVEYCVSAGAVSGDEAGGIVGSMEAGSFVTQCIATGSVTGGIAGGIVGTKEASSSVFRCYAHGSVRATDSIGTIVGRAANTALAPSYGVIGCYYNGQASFDGTDYEGNALAVNRYGSESAWEIAEDIPWNPSVFDTEGSIPSLKKGAVEFPETVTVTTDAETAAGTTVIIPYHTAFEAVPVAEEGTAFAGWYFDRWLTVPYDASIPLCGDETLYAAFVSTAIFERKWENARRTLDLTEESYQLIGAQLTDDYGLVGGAALIYAESGVYYKATIDAYEGTLTWAVSGDGLNWSSETESFMAEHSAFVGSWVDTLYGSTLVISDTYQADGYLYMVYQGDAEMGYKTKVSLDAGGNARVSILSDWGMEWFFDENGTLSYDFGYMIITYAPDADALARNWLSYEGNVLAISADSETVDLDGVSASYTMEQGEQGARMKFTLGNEECFFRFDGKTAILNVGVKTVECVLYNYDSFLGEWQTGDLSTRYTIAAKDASLTISKDGAAGVVMKPGIANGALQYRFLLDGKDCRLNLVHDVLLDLNAGVSELLYQKELTDTFVGEYTNYLQRYTIDEQYRMSYSELRAGGWTDPATSEGGFDYLVLDETTGEGVIVYECQINGVNTVVMFITVEPKWIMIVDQDGELFAFDTETVEDYLAPYVLAEDVWSSGGKSPVEMTFDTEGTLTLDGKAARYMLVYDFDVQALALYFNDPRAAEGTVPDIYEACYVSGTVYLSNVSALLAGEEDLGLTFIPSEEVKKFIGTYVYGAVGGDEYVIYKADGSCYISTQVTDADGNQKVELKEYHDIRFYSSLNLLDPTMTCWYMGFRPSEYIPDYSPSFYLNVVRYGNNTDYTMIAMICYTRSDVFPFVGLLKGEDNSKLEIGENASIKLNGESVESVVYQKNDDGTTTVTFVIPEAIDIPFLGIVGHPEYRYKGVMQSADGGYRIELTNETTGETVVYTKYVFDHSAICKTWQNGNNKIKFEMREVLGAKELLFVSVNDGEATSDISYEFNEDGALVYVFTINYVTYRVTVGAFDIEVTTSYSSVPDIPDPPIPPAPPLP